MITALVLALVMLASPASAAQLERFELNAREVEGCPGVPYPRFKREFWVSPDAAVDVKARFWTIDRPSLYEGRDAVVRYRIGSGTLRVEAEMSEDLSTEVVRIEVERPIEDSYLTTYLSRVELPCERRTRYSVKRLEPAEGDIDELAAFDALLLRANELLYDDEFDRAMELLEQARALRPADSTPYWMMARLRYLQTEERAEELPPEVKIEAYREVERFADQAVERAPLRAEGYLWQGIARGRIATSIGNVRIALRGMLGGRGPAWLEKTLRNAVSMQNDYRFFGFSTRADALHALAQFYRLVPDDWYMTLVGTRGNLGRAIELSAEAVQLQPVRIEYRTELAVELMCRAKNGDRDEARRQLESALEIPAITPLDRIDHRHARQLLQNPPPEEICWYSRDGFLESPT